MDKNKRFDETVSKWLEETAPVIIQAPLPRSSARGGFAPGVDLV